mgnify:CR=1 FL=1
MNHFVLDFLTYNYVLNHKKLAALMLKKLFLKKKFTNAHTY